MSYTRLLYHIVTSTKERRPFLRDEVLDRLKPYLGGMIKTLGGQPIRINGVADHIHIVAALKPTLALSKAIKELKSKSSGWIHQTFPDLAAFHWQDTYAAFTVSPSLLDRVVEYVENQQEHHSKRGFVEELKLLLDRHGIEYDPKYLE